MYRATYFIPFLENHPSFTQYIIGGFGVGGEALSLRAASLPHNVLFGAILRITSLLALNG
jgi:hypothetical protein